MIRELSIYKLDLFLMFDVKKASKKTLRSLDCYLIILFVFFWFSRLFDKTQETDFYAL